MIKWSSVDSSKMQKEKLIFKLSLSDLTNLPLSSVIPSLCPQALQHFTQSFEQDQKLGLKWTEQCLLLINIFHTFIYFFDKSNNNLTKGALDSLAKRKRLKVGKLKLSNSSDESAQSTNLFHFRNKFSNEFPKKVFTLISNATNGRVAVFVNALHAMERNIDAHRGEGRGGRQGY